MMSELLMFFLKANLSIAILWTVYYFFFRNTTLHQTNRLLLLSILLFSAVVPLLQFRVLSTSEPVFTIDNWADDINFFPGDIQVAQPINAASNKFNFILIGQLIYLAIIGLLFIRFAIQLLDFKRIFRNSIKHNSDKGEFRVSSHINTPFSFWRWIFIPEDLPGKSQMNMIVAHEKVHAKHLHTLDLLVTELFCIIFWFNPFVFLLKRSLKTVHEYIADQHSVKSNIEKIEFLSLLAAGVNLSIANGISSNFYWSTIKKRINMITKNKSSKLRKLSYLLLIPAFGFVLMSFSGFVTEPSFISTMKLDFGNDIPSIHPIKDTESVKMTSGYGMRMHPIKKKKMMHRGVDFACPEGTPVVATADGEVVKKEFNPKGYGRFIIIKHNDTFSTLYSQMSEFKVELGDKVKQGQVIGLVGSSGVSTGSHLHYEIKKDGKNVNPADYIPEVQEMPESKK